MIKDNNQLNFQKAKSNVKMIREKLKDNVKAFENEFIKENYQNSVMIIGNAGSGRTTLLNFLSRKRLKAFDEEGEIRIRIDEPDNLDETKEQLLKKNQISKYEENQTVYWDCPGFNDDINTIQDIADSIFLKYIIDRSDNVKFILIVPNTITTGRKNGLQNVLESLDRLFFGKTTNFINSIMLIVSKVPKNVSIIKMKARLKKIEDSMDENAKELLKYLSENLIIFYEPDSEEILSENSNLRSEIIDKLNNTTSCDKSMKLNTSPSDKSKLEIIDWFKSISQNILSKLIEMNKELVNCIKKKSDKSLSYDMFKLSKEFVYELENHDIDHFNIEKFNNFLIEMEKKLPKFKKETVMSNEIYELSFFLEENLIDTKECLNFRSDLLNELKRLFNDLKFYANTNINIFNEDSKIACQIFSQINNMKSQIDKFEKELTVKGENVVIIIGRTGSGKSTLLNYICGQKLVGYDDDGEIKIKLVDEVKNISKIGNEYISVTSNPIRCQTNEYIFWDCPGFEDNRNYEQDIFNAFYLVNIIRSSKKIRIIALLKHESTKGKSNPFRDFVEQIDTLFSNDENQYKDALSIVVTHVENDSLVKIKDRLIKMLETMKDSDGKPLKNKNVLKNIIENRLSLFHVPQDGEVLGNDDKVKIIANINELKPLVIDEEGSCIRITPSISNETTIKIIGMYKEINTLFQKDLKEMINTFYKININALENGEKLSNIKEKIDEIIKNIPSVILINQIKQIIQMIYNQNKINILENSDSDMIGLDDRLKMAEFLEKIVPDYVKYKPINLCDSFTILLDLRYKIEQKELKAKFNFDVNRQEKEIFLNKKEEEEKRKWLDEKATAEMEIKNKEYEEKQKLNLKNVFIIGGSSIGLGIAGFIVQYGIIGSTLGPIGTGVGVFIGLIAGGIYSYYKKNHKVN